jgi:hypothetical protein
MTEKLNIILDLDNCCIHALSISTYNNDKKMVEYMTKELKKDGNNVDILKYKFDSEKDDRYKILFIRPHLKIFLEYLLKNYNVSVWSNGYYTYVDKICNIIFTKEQKKQLKYIIGATDNPKWGVYDIKNKKFLYDFNSYKNIVKDTSTFSFTDRYDVKDLSFLWKNKPYSSIFTKENTILIDDAENHLVFNKYNVLPVKYWVSYDKSDRTLLNVLNYLKKKSIIDTTKLKHFTKTKKDKKTKKK